jgi:hypothetical protein
MTELAGDQLDGNDVRVSMDDLTDEPDGHASALAVPLVADSIASPRLVYGGLDLRHPDGADQAYSALYFEVARSGELGRVTFEGLDAVRGSRGEQWPYKVVDHAQDGWVYLVEGAGWLRERHAYEMRHYKTPLLDTHQHYLFVFHDEFVEAIAEGIWFDLADRDDQLAAPPTHPLSPLSPELPNETFASAQGLVWQLQRSPRGDAELLQASRYCSQRVYQFNLTLDGQTRESASIWVRTTRHGLVSRFTRPWPVGEVARTEGFAQPSDFAQQWETYLAEVAQRRSQMGKQ